MPVPSETKVILPHVEDTQQAQEDEANDGADAEPVAEQASQFSFMALSSVTVNDAAPASNNFSLDEFTMLLNSAPPAPAAPAAVVQPPAVPVTQVKEEPKESSPVSEGSFQLPASLTSDLIKANDHFQSSLTSIRYTYLRSYNTQQSILSKIDGIAVHASQTLEKISSLELKQMALANEENFEAADSISNEIELLQKEQESKKSEKIQLLKQLTDLRKEYLVDKAKLVADFMSNLQSLSLACEQTEDYTSKFIIKLEEFSHDEKSRIAVEQQRVDMEKNHCERERQALLNENQVIEDAIKSQVGDYYVKQEHLATQLTDVRDEIKVLEEQLAAKRAIETDLAKNLKTIELKIQESRKKFDRQIQRINERLDILSKSQHECDAEEELLQSNISKVETMITNANQIIEDSKCLIEKKQKEHHLANTIIEDLQTIASVGSSSSGSSSGSGISAIGLDCSWDAYDILQSDINENVRSKREQIAEIESSLAKIRGGLTDLKVQREVRLTKHRSLIEQIDQLELAKKLHAANKRFKEAAASAKDLKEITEQKESIEKDLQQSSTSIISQEEELEQLESKLQMIQESLREDQKLERLEHVEKLSNRIHSIQRLVKRLEKVEGQLANTSAGIASSSSSAQNVPSLVQEAKLLYNAELNQLLQLRSLLCESTGIPVPEDPVIEDEPEEVEEEPSATLAEEPATEAEEDSNENEGDHDVVATADDDAAGERSSATNELVVNDVLEACSKSAEEAVEVETEEADSAEKEEEKVVIDVEVRIISSSSF
jgi:hypothetical protein